MGLAWLSAASRTAAQESCVELADELSAALAETA
jgi:hypothetical protein